MVHYWRGHSLKRRGAFLTIPPLGMHVILSPLVLVFIQTKIVIAYRKKEMPNYLLRNLNLNKCKIDSDISFFVYKLN